MCRSLSLIAGLVAVAIFVQVGAVTRIDRFGVTHLQPLTGSSYGYLTLPADPLVTTALIGGAILVLRSQGRAVEATTWGVAFVVGVGVEVAGKLSVDQTQFNSTERVFDLLSLPGSFPSGHAMRAILLGAIAGTLWPRVRAVAIAASFAVAVAVELTGMHVISDVVGGALAGAALAASVSLLTDSRRPLPLVPGIAIRWRRCGSRARG